MSVKQAPPDTGFCCKTQEADQITCDHEACKYQGCKGCFCNPRRYLPMWLIFNLVVAVGCLTALIVCGMMIAKPYEAAKHYTESSCTTVGNWSYHYGAAVLKECKCGRHCRSELPCVDVMVNYSIPGQGHALGHFYPTDIQLSKGSECSYDPNKCDREVSKNWDGLKVWLQDFYAQGSPFTCYYESAGPGSKVIGKKTHNFNAVLHSLLWPGLGLLQSTIWIVVLGCNYRSYRKEHNLKCKASPFQPWLYGYKPGQY